MTRPWYGETLHISTGSNLSRDGYSLKEWNTKSDGTGISLKLGSYKLAEESNLTLYAIWVKTSTYQINFDYNGAVAPENDTSGNWIESKTVVYEQSIGTLPQPTRDGYSLDGWFVYVDYPPSKYNDNQTYAVKGSITLTARWAEVANE